MFPWWLDWLPWWHSEYTLRCWQVLQDVLSWGDENEPYQIKFSTYTNYNITKFKLSYNGSRSPIFQVPQLLPVKRYKIRSHYDGVFSLCFTHDGTRLAVGYGSGDVTLHNTKTAKLTCCPSRKSDQLPVTGLQFRGNDRSDMLYCLASGPIFLQRVRVVVLFVLSVFIFIKIGTKIINVITIARTCFKAMTKTEIITIIMILIWAC